MYINNYKSRCHKKEHRLYTESIEKKSKNDIVNSM